VIPTITINITASLAIYRFYSTFSSSVIKYITAFLLLRVLQITPFIPTMPFLLDKLIAIYIP